jgi:hypothetical protein
MRPSPLLMPGWSQQQMDLIRWTVISLDYEKL